MILTTSSILILVLVPLVGFLGRQVAFSEVTRKLRTDGAAPPSWLLFCKPTA